MLEQSFNQPLEDEISLKDIIDFLSESWKAIALSGIIGGLLATGYAFITPPTYKATANIQVAKVAGLDVEAPIILMEKLKMPTYYSIDSYSACNVMDSIEPGEIIVKKIKPILSKTSPIISFSYIEKSPEAAQKCLESILNVIRNSQNLLAKPILESKKNQLLSMKNKLDDAERIMKSLPKKNLSYDFSDVKFSASALLLATMFNKQNEIRDLMTQINDLEISLAEPQTKETFLIAPIYAPNQKAFPKRTLILMGGVVVGLFLGLLFMIGKRSWQAYKTSNQ
jgi:capsular polysaccharide biosynthesis protein